MVRTQIRFGWDMALGHEFLREARKGDGLSPSNLPSLPSRLDADLLARARADIVRYTDKYKMAEAKPTTLDPKDYAPRELQPAALYDSYHTPEAAKKRAAAAAGLKGAFLCLCSLSAVLRRMLTIDWSDDGDTPRQAARRSARRPTSTTFSRATTAQATRCVSLYFSLAARLRKLTVFASGPSLTGGRFGR